MSRLASLVDLLAPLGEEHPAPAMRRLAASDGDPLSRHHFVPGHFTASGFVLSPARDALLLVHHRKLGMWLQPGGHIDPADPDIPTAARREAEEESGLTGLELMHGGVFDLDIHHIPSHGAEPAHSHYDVRFLFQAASTQLRPSQELLGAKWVPLTEAGAKSDGSVARVVTRLVERYG